MFRTIEENPNLSRLNPHLFAVCLQEASESTPICSLYCMLYEVIYHIPMFSFTSDPSRCFRDCTVGCMCYTCVELPWTFVWISHTSELLNAKQPNSLQKPNPGFPNDVLELAGNNLHECSNQPPTQMFLLMSDHASIITLATLRPLNTAEIFILFFCSVWTLNLNKPE